MFAANTCEPAAAPDRNLFGGMLMVEFTTRDDPIATGRAKMNIAGSEGKG